VKTKGTKKQTKQTKTQPKGAQPKITPSFSVDARDRPALPERIERLWEFATNVSWTWDRDARAVFRAMDITLWRRTRHNPVKLLLQIREARLEALVEDGKFLERYDALCSTVDRDSSAESTWFVSQHPELADDPVAYFCAEFALHESIPIYSGGLGVLAGDHLKAASDLGVPFVAVGLMYGRGYFDQTLRLDGWQEDGDQSLDPTTTPLERLRGGDGNRWLTWIYSSGRRVYIGAWRVKVGRVTLYLLDTDIEENDPQDRELSHNLYAGGVDHRLRQEGLLGIGGVRVLDALGIEPRAWHANEGHATFMMVERVRRLTKAGVPFDEAVAQVRATSVFTTHTPVPAGHDVFSHEQMRDWTGKEFWEKLEERESLLALGLHPEDKEKTQFHMTAAAIRLSARVNGVSKRHGQVSREIWRGIWKGRTSDEIPIGHVTNGVHLATWMNNDIMGLLDQHLAPDWGYRVDDPEMWAGMSRVPSEALWEIHQRLKLGLIDFMREEARRRWRDHWTEAAHLVGAGTLMSPYPLTIGFARRFATYKRADLLFSDPERLLALLAHPRRPVQLIFAGKAHPRDEDGKRILQRVYAHTRDPRFEGRVAFLEDYGLHIAHRLVAGVDLWLNLPRVPHEASGTSGMKAALNGVPQLATADGWWEEGFAGNNGWIVPPNPTGTSEDEEDAQDMEHVFRLLEQEVVPLFYDRPREGSWQGAPLGWVEHMKRSIEIAGRKFTARRQVQDYVRDYYVPALRADGEGDDPPDR